MNVQLVIFTGLFSLGGVLLGALLTPLTQLYLERKRDQRAADRAKLLVAAELLHAQLTIRTASKSKYWPNVEDVNSFLPTSAWQENRSSLAGKVHEDLWNQLVMTYAILEIDRARFVLGSRSQKQIALPAKEAEVFKQFSNDLGCLRRKLGGGGGWLDELKDEFKPQLDSLNDNFKRWLDGLSDDDLKKDSVIAKVKSLAKDLGEMNRHLGDDGAWSAEINDDIKRRLK